MEYRWYEQGRMIVKSKDIDGNDLYGMSKEYFDDRIAINKVYDGNLNLPKGVTSLGELETVNGYLNLRKSKITSLGNLKSVSGGLYFDSLKLTSLGVLKNVGGVIFCDKDNDLYGLLMNSEFKNRVYP